MPRISLIALALVLMLAGCTTPTAPTTPPTDRQAGMARARISQPVSTPTQPTRRTVNLPGVQLSILEAGNGDPVIYVHGVVTTSNIFPKHVAAYSPAYRGIAVDLRGYGESEKTPSGSNIDQFVADLIALADHLDIRKPVWVGVSMGGMILQRLALTHPDRVRALVLVSTTDGAMILDKDLPTIGIDRDYREVSKHIIVESFPAGTNPRLYQPLLDRISTWNGDVLREALTSMSRFDLHGRLTAITAPTLIMVGAKDDVATPAIAKGIQSQIAGSQLVEFDTGHFMMAENPEQFQSVLGAFLTSLPR
ncbi:MAG: alpha/beta hydrolase [Nitrospiraceae bacterium]|nr:alpha/beta hydrolase [Nitrospiraceae bacterium]